MELSYQPSSTRRRTFAVAGALLAMYATSPGQTFVVSTYNESLRAAADQGGLAISATQLSGAYLCGTLMSAACLTHAGKLADRVGPRRMIAMAGVGLALAGLGFSNAAGLVTLTLAFFGLRFFGQGVMTLASSHALALRFDTKLGSVEGLRGGSVSLAIATAPLIAITAVDRLGWRTAAWVLPLGAGSLACIAAYVLLDRDPPRDAGVPSGSGGTPEADSSGSMTLPEARRTLPFWILLGCSAFTGAYITAIHFHLQPLLAARGMGEGQAAATFVPFAAAGLVATLTGGLLVDRFRPGPLLCAAVTMLATGGVALSLGEGALGAHVGMGIVGIGHGLGNAVGAPTLARFFGRAHHGAIRGAAGTAVVAGSALGPYVLSAIAGSDASAFGDAVLLGASVGVPLALMALALGPPVARHRG